MYTYSSINSEPSSIRYGFNRLAYEEKISVQTTIVQIEKTATKQTREYKIGICKIEEELYSARYCQGNWINWCKDGKVIFFLVSTLFVQLYKIKYLAKKRWNKPDRSLWTLVIDVLFHFACSNVIRVLRNQKNFILFIFGEYRLFLMPWYTTYNQTIIIVYRIEFFSLKSISFFSSIFYPTTSSNEIFARKKNIQFQFEMSNMKKWNQYQRYTVHDNQHDEMLMRKKLFGGPPITCSIGNRPEKRRLFNKIILVLTKWFFFHVSQHMSIWVRYSWILAGVLPNNLNWKTGKTSVFKNI